MMCYLKNCRCFFLNCFCFFNAATCKHLNKIVALSIIISYISFYFVFTVCSSYSLLFCTNFKHANKLVVIIIILYQKKRSNNNSSRRKRIIKI